MSNDGKEVYKNDFIVFNGIKPTLPFSKRSVTKYLDLLINTRVGQGIVNIEFQVSTTIGSINFILRD